MSIEELRRPLVDGTTRMPVIDRFTGWKEVPIDESGQPLVLLDTLFTPAQATFSPEYFTQGIDGSIDLFILREEAASRLKDAASFLPEGHTFILFDAYRPLSVQQSLFDSFMSVLREERPELTPDELLIETQRFVSLPSDNPERPSPHYTGGSIDLSILDENGLELDMGTPFDSFDPASKTSFYQDRLDESVRAYHENRLLLYGAMTDAGFTNYPEEWWHFDYGNQFWGKCTNQPAIYGGVQLI